MSLDALPSDVLTYLAATPSPLIQEIVKVEWQRGANTKYYSSTAVQALTGFTGLTGLGISSVEPRFAANQFLDVPLSAGLEDDSAPLDFWDGDGVISALFRASGEGTKVTAYYYLPAVAYLKEYFWGYLRVPKDSSRLRFKTEATEGLRTPEIQIPRRIFQAACQATFGGEVDPVTSTRYFTTLAQVAANDCPYDIHISGGTVGVPGFTTCPKRSRADCIARIGDDRSYLAFDVIIEQTRFGKNNRFVAYTRANESASKEPLRVVYGYRFVDGLTLLGHYVQASAGGFLVTLSAISEGEINGQWGHTLNGNVPNFNNVLTRNGALRQYPTGFSPTALNYSGTALARIDYKVGTTQYSADQIHTACFVEGRKVRVYSDASTYSDAYSRSRAWCLLDLMASRRFGLGYDYSRFVPQDWIDLNTWSAQDVTGVVESGSTVSSSTSIPTDAQSGGRIYASYQSVPDDDSDDPDDTPTPTYTDASRTRFDAILDGRDARQAVRDICMAGRYGIPFHYEGKLRIIPLKKESDLGSTAIPTFTDQGTSGRNILFEKQGDAEVSTLTWSQKSDAEIVNQIKVTFDNETYQWAEHSIILKDEPAQLAAGRALGDTSKRVVEKAYALLGTTRYHEALRSAKILLDLGEFDSGGLENNLTIKFQTWFPLAQALRLHKYRVIRVDNTFVNAYTERTAAAAFRYFRIMKMRRREQLKVEITAQAYPEEYYDTIEAGAVIHGGVTGTDGPVRITGVGRPARPISRRITLVSRAADHVVVRVG